MAWPSASPMPEPRVPLPNRAHSWGHASAMSKQRTATAPSGWIRTFYAHLTFDVPIPRKLWVFCSAVGVWFMVLGGAGGWLDHSSLGRGAIVAMVLLALGALVAFGVRLTRAMRDPLIELNRRIAVLAEGGHVEGLSAVSTVTTNDEVAELAQRVDELVHAFQRVSAFKNVIEEDETADDVYRRLGAEFEAIGLPRYTVYEVSNSQNRLRPACRGDGFPEDCCEPDVILSSQLCRARRTGEVASSLAFPGVCKRFQAKGAHHVCIPMMVGGSTGGVVTFLFDAEVDAEEARPMLAKARQFIRESAGVIEAKRLMDTLKESTLRDPMTGLYNRRFLEEYTQTLVASAKRRGATIGVLMCDIDHFKHVNDTYGHDVGDTVLKEVASTLVKATRASDLVIRLGGEEFLVILQDAVPGTPMEVADRIRASVEGVTIRTPKGPLQKTLSVGVAEFPTDGGGLWDVVKLADAALYHAKGTGRNRCVRSSADLRVEGAKLAACPPAQSEPLAA